MITAGFTHGRSGFFGVAAPAGPGVPALPVEDILPDDGRLAEVVVAAVPGVEAAVEAGAAVVEAAGAGVAEPVEAGAADVEAAAPAAGAPPMRVLAAVGAPPIRFFGAAASPVSDAGADGVLAWAVGAPPMRRFGAPAAAAAGAFEAAGDAVDSPATGWAVAES